MSYTKTLLTLRNILHAFIKTESQKHLKSIPKVGGKTKNTANVEIIFRRVQL